MTTAGTKLQALTERGISFDPVRDTQRTFRVLLEVMARPGTVARLPVAPADAPTNPWLASVLVTLLDHEVSLAVTPFIGADEIERYARQRTSAGPAVVGDANFVVASWETLDADLPHRLRTGTLEYPDDGATLILLVPALAQDDASMLRLELAGPGVPHGHSLRLAGVPTALFDARTAAAEYPCGIDIILINPDGCVAALPRSTTVLSRSATFGSSFTKDEA